MWGDSKAGSYERFEKCIHLVRPVDLDVSDIFPRECDLEIFGVIANISVARHC